MYREGSWIIDKKYGGDVGTVSNVFLDGVTARFGNRVAIRTFEDIELAPLNIQQEDMAAMIDLALATNDKDWFSELVKKMGVEIHG